MTRPTLIIFVREPRPGTAKTRLIPELGTHGAAILQHRLTLRTLTAAGRGHAAVQLHVSGDLEAAARLYPGPWTIHPQRDGDLGRRLAAAADVPGPVAVIGTDCPGLTAAHLSDAFGRLEQADVALGPALDGGYYLLAMRRFTPALFQDIDWSTDRVAAQTRAAAVAAGLTVAELPPLGDVDTPDDLPLMPPIYAPNRITVTGSTGAIGSRFIARLLHDVPWTVVTALIRSAPPPPLRRLLDRYPSRIELIRGDLRSLSLPAADRRRLAQADGFWHFAADTALAGRDAAVWAANDAGTAAVLDLLASADAPAPLFHLSTAFVCGSAAGVVREDDLPTDGFRNAYEASKASAERRVRDAFAAGLHGCIFRPSVVVEDDPAAGSPKMVDVVAAALAAGPVTMRLPATAALNCVHADWLLAVMSTLADTPDGRTYHLTARQPLRLAALPGVNLDATIQRRDLPPPSRLLDRAVDPFRPYLTADVTFDRSNLDAAAPHLAGLTECDPAIVLAHRRRGRDAC